MTKWDLLFGVQGFFNIWKSINIMYTLIEQRIKNTVISTNRKIIWKNANTFSLKTLKIRIGINLFNIIKIINEKPTTNILYNGKKKKKKTWKLSLWDQKQNKDAHCHYLTFSTPLTIVLEVQGRAVRQEKKWKTFKLKRK